MPHTFKGETLNYDGTVRIGSATVRLYRKDTNELVSTTTSDADGKWSITVSEVLEAPWKYFVIGYTSQFQAGIVDLQKPYHVMNFHIYNDITDNNTDLIKVDLPNRTQTRVKKLIISSPVGATSDGSIGIYNLPNGNGNSIIVNLNNGDTFKSNTGDIGTNSYYWIRSIVACGISNTTFSIIYEYPDLQPPY